MGKMDCGERAIRGDVQHGQLVAEELLEVLHMLRRFMTHGLPECEGEGRHRHGPGSDLQDKRGQSRLMFILLKHGRMTMQGLADHLGVTPPTVTGMVKRLVEQGFVRRVHDESDWRTVWVELTPQGQEAITRHHRERTAALQQRLDRLDPEDRARLAMALPVLRKLFDFPSGNQ